MSDFQSHTEDSLPPTEGSAFIINIQSAEQYQQQVIEASQHQPVLVDFWADWCQPCQILIPLLSKLAVEYNGAFVLAKVNSDEQQQLAAANGIRSLPSVKLYKDGQVIDEFMGAKTESDIRQFLEQHIISEADRQISQALELAENGHYDQAIPLLKTLNQQDPGNVRVYTAIARVYLLADDLENCSAVIKALPVNLQTEKEVLKLKSELELILAAADAPAMDELIKQLEKEPDNQELQLQLANQYTANKNYAQALQTLLGILSRDIDFKEGKAKQAILKIFEILGDQDPLTRKYRSRLASLLY